MRGTEPQSERETSGFLIPDKAGARLESVDPQPVAVARLRHFAGPDIEATGSAQGVSAPTVKRAWVFARGCLEKTIESGRV